MSKRKERKVMETIKRKLYLNMGESIGETLIALLVASLALVMLAGAISSGSNSITKSKDKLDKYYSATEDVVTRSSDSSTEYRYTIVSGTMMITDPSNTIQFNPGGESVTFYENNEFSNKPVIAYKKS